MADVKVTDLAAATSLASTDLLYAVVSGSGRKVTVSDLTRQLYGSTTITATVGGVERLRIDSSGNVGIGVSPSARLHAYNATGGTVARLQTGTTANGNFLDFQNAASARQGLVGFIDSTNLYIHNDAAAAIIFDTSNTERLRIDSSGNVAVGTVTAIEKLTVNQGNAYLLRTGGAKVRLSDQNNEVSVESLPVGAASDMLFKTSTLERMRLDASGNLGIATASPLVPLDVNGAALTRGVSYKYQPAQTSKAAAATLTIAELLTGIVQYTGAAANLTLPTGASIDGGIPASFPNDMSFDFTIINTGSGAATVVTNTGLTTVGALAVAAGSSAQFRVRKTAASTYTVYRIA